jgi:hypothetical protein
MIKYENLTLKHKNIYLKYIYRLIQGLFHIASARYQSRADDKGNMKKAMY